MYISYFLLRVEYIYTHFATQIPSERESVVCAISHGIVESGAFGKSVMFDGSRVHDELRNLDKPRVKVRRSVCTPKMNGMTSSANTPHSPPPAISPLDRYIVLVS